MKCHYCKTQLGDPYYHGCPAPVILTCKACPVEVTYYFDGKFTVFKTVFGHQLNNKFYEVSLKSHKHLCYLYIIKNNLSFSILSGETVASLTPQNIANKLPTILTFL
jgi:hypothetical protein